MFLFAGLILVILEKNNVTGLVKSPDESAGQLDSSKAQAEQRAALDAKIKQDYLDGVAESNSTPETPLPSGARSELASGGNLTVTASQSGASVTILTQIVGITLGTCKLGVANGVVNTTQSTQIIYQPEFSSCAGFSVPVSELGAGLWNITVTITPDMGTPLTKTATLEVR